MLADSDTTSSQVVFFFVKGKNVKENRKYYCRITKSFVLKVQRYTVEDWHRSSSSPLGEYLWLDLITSVVTLKRFFTNFFFEFTNIIEYMRQQNNNRIIYCGLLT